MDYCSRYNDMKNDDTTNLLRSVLRRLAQWPSHLQFIWMHAPFRSFRGLNAISLRHCWLLLPSSTTASPSLTSCNNVLHLAVAGDCGTRVSQVHVMALAAGGAGGRRGGIFVEWVTHGFKLACPRRASPDALLLHVVTMRHRSSACSTAFFCLQYSTVSEWCCHRAHCTQ